MNIIQIQDQLKNLSDQQLAGEMKNPTGQAPQFLVLSELKRRKDLRDGFQQRNPQQPQSSLAEEIPAAVMQRNMQGMMGNPMAAGMGNMPRPVMPQAPQMPQQPQGFSGGGLVSFAQGGGVPDMTPPFPMQMMGMTPMGRMSRMAGDAMGMDYSGWPMPLRMMMTMHNRMAPQPQSRLAEALSPYTQPTEDEVYETSSTEETASIDGDQVYKDKRASSVTPTSKATSIEKKLPGRGPVKAVMTEAPSGTSYVVKKGDTLWDLAGGSAKRVADLMKWNNIADPRRLQIGQELTLVAPQEAGPKPGYYIGKGPQAPDVPNSLAESPKSDVSAPLKSKGVANVWRDVDLDLPTNAPLKRSFDTMGNYLGAAAGMGGLAAIPRMLPQMAAMPGRMMQSIRGLMPKPPIPHPQGTALLKPPIGQRIPQQLPLELQPRAPMPQQPPALLQRPTAPVGRMEPNITGKSKFIEPKLEPTFKGEAPKVPKDKVKMGRPTPKKKLDETEPRIEPTGFARGGLASIIDSDEDSWDRLETHTMESPLRSQVEYVRRDEKGNPITVGKNTYFKSFDEHRRGKTPALDEARKFDTQHVQRFAGGGPAWYAPPPLSATGNFIPGGNNELENKRIMQEYINMTDPMRMRDVGTQNDAAQALYGKMRTPFDAAYNYYLEERKKNANDPNWELNNAVYTMKDRREEYINNELKKYKPQVPASVAQTAAKAEAEKKATEANKGSGILPQVNYTPGSAQQGLPKQPDITGSATTGSGAGARAHVSAPIGIGAGAYTDAARGAQTMLNAFGGFPIPKTTTPEEEYAARSQFMPQFSELMGKYDKYREQETADFTKDKEANRNWLLAELGMKMLNSSSGRKGFGGAMAEFGQAGGETIPKVLSMRAAETQRQRELNRDALEMQAKEFQHRSTEKGASWDRAKQSEDKQDAAKQQRAVTGATLGSKIYDSNIDYAKALIIADAEIKSAERAGAGGGMGIKEFTALSNARAKVEAVIEATKHMKDEQSVSSRNRAIQMRDVIDMNLEMYFGIPSGTMGMPKVPAMPAKGGK